MRSAILFPALALHYVFNAHVIVAQESPVRSKMMKSHEIPTHLMEQFNAQRGKRGGKLKSKMERVDAFKSQRRHLGGLHREVSEKLAAHHEGRALLDEETLTVMTRRQEELEQRRASLGRVTF